jgi:hypothetical protein
MAVHYLIAAFSFAAAFLWLKSLPLAVFSSAVSVFLDADHLLDYFLANGSDFDPQKFLRETKTGEYFNRSGRVIVFLHSWEILLLFFAVAIVLNTLRVYFAFLLGFVPHLLWDQITYAKSPLLYFFLYRARHKFRKKILC